MHSPTDASQTSSRTESIWNGVSAQKGNREISKDSEREKKNTSAFRHLLGSSMQKTTRETHPSFDMDESWAAELVDQLAAFILNLVQNFRVVVPLSTHVYSPVHPGPVEARFVRHGMVVQVAVAETIAASEHDRRCRENLKR